MATSSQAKRVIRRFGGVTKLCQAMEDAGHPISRQAVYRWTYPLGQGSGGIIPGPQLRRLIQAAATAGIELTDTDLSPLEYEDDEETDTKGDIWE